MTKREQPTETNEPDESRRKFLKTSLQGATALTLGAQLLAQTSDAAAAGIPTRPLGRTGANVSILCLGGWHIGAIANQTEAIKVMHAAIDEGITFFDNAWDYHDGGSEEVVGKALASGGRRDKVFLMTKGCDRDYAGATRCLEDSLRRFKTDHIDLWQFHEIVYDNDPDWVFEKNGIQAAIDAQKAGKVRFIGFTGHRDPRIHQVMLDKPYDWDTVQMPINVMDANFRSFQQQIVPQCLQRGAGVIGMKSLGGGVIPSQAGISAETCIRYALSQPISSLVVGLLSMDDLKKNVATGRSFKPMSDSEQQALVESVKDVAGDGRYELYKTTQLMDGPYHVKQHGFTVVG
jgi:predicted aldo/keto reductase-like oxidoreductase|tara:strand:+ start:1846 stop:2886 length:1041 start_codon:yes stop_codon:yes gene_type:complete